MTNAANLGIETLMRPAWNFELDYDQASGDTPILFTWPAAKERPPLGQPDLSVLDSDANKVPVRPGTSPVLAKFVTVPAGASMLVLYPVVTRTVGAVLRPWSYVWRVVWRWRSAGDYVKAEKRRPYLIGKTSFGASDTRAKIVPNRNIPVAGKRLVVPAASESVIYAKNEPNPFGIQGVPVNGTLMSDSVAIPASFNSVTRSPLYPGQFQAPAFPPPDQYVRTMDYQQGVFDPNFPGISNPENPSFAFNPITATYLAKWLKSLGNEFAIECFKFEYSAPDDAQSFVPRKWDFQIDQDGKVGLAAEDFAFSVMFGIGALSISGQNIPVDTGVRVTVGAAPE